MKTNLELSIVRSDEKYLGNLDLKEAAKKTSETSSSDLPKLVTDLALSGCNALVANHVRENILQGYIPAIEILPKPKQRYGNRPLAVLDVTTRTYLAALAGSLKGIIPDGSMEGNHDEFKYYGIDRSGKWILEFDITSCYEYLDHIVLANELILQGAEQSSVEYLCQLLNSLFHRHVGLPQGVSESDRLAAVYLDLLQRRLKRKGYDIVRFADDFRVVVDSRREAYIAIEDCMEEARRIYLSLAEQKISISQAEVLKEQFRNFEEIFEGYSEDAFGELIDYTLIPGIYDDIIEEYYPAPDDVDFEATVKLLNDWIEAGVDRRAALARAGMEAIRRAAGMDRRIDNKILSRIVEKDPLRLKLIAHYISKRSESSDNWELLDEVSGQDRITPWHKVWILTSATKLDSVDCLGEQRILEYAKTQVHDSHEAVRLQAAWLLALNGVLQTDDLVSLYEKSTAVSAFGLSAIAGLVSKNKSNGALEAIRDDSKVNKHCFEWGSTVECKV